MTGDRLYDLIGAEPMTDEEIEAAIAEYTEDHPDADELQRWGVEQRLRRLNTEARQRAADEAEARKARTTVPALRRAKAEKAEHERRERDARDLAAARRAVRAPEAGVVRRPPGRPGWTQSTFHAAYREARDRAGGLQAQDKTIADEMAVGLQWFGRLIRRFGRPG